MNSAQNKSADETGKPPTPASLFAQFVAPWTALSGMWNAWYEAMRSVSSERAIDLTKSFGGVSEPGGKLAPLFEELQNALRLPRFADLPMPDFSILHSSAALMDLAGLVQQYLALSVPMWAEASRRFQREMADRVHSSERIQSPAEALDVWNGVFDRTLMESNRSGEFIRIHQRLLRGSMMYRLELRKLAERASRIFDIPTRQEMTDLYHHLHEMQRENHKLRQEVRALRNWSDSEMKSRSQQS
jgi:hypothetical protein